MNVAKLLAFIIVAYILFAGVMIVTTRELVKIAGDTEVEAKVPFLSSVSNSNSEIPYTQTYTGISLSSHENISIMGNSQFNHTDYPDNGVVSGDGSAASPYIIEGWQIVCYDINHSTGISIGGTDAYFVIRNCYIYGDVDAISSGIVLGACTNGVVETNTCINGEVGIWVDKSSQNIINDNDCSYNAMSGITLFQSSHNTIRNNTCSNNYAGIEIYSSILGSSANNTIINNHCSVNSMGIYAHWFFNNNQGTFTNNTISNNDCSNNIGGIYFAQSCGDTISNNNCSSNYWDGINLWVSSNNTVSGNQLWNNLRYGVNITSLYGYIIFPAYNNRIWNNFFIDNNGAGSIFNASHSQAFDNTPYNRWNTSTRGNYWSDWTMPDLDMDGIVDIPYNISGGANAKDYLPLSLITDLEPPVTTALLSGTRGDNGWYKSEVALSLHAIDNESGVNKTYYRIGTSQDWQDYSSPFVISDEGIVSVEFWSVDNAGNEEPTNTIFIKIDMTKPISSFTWLTLYPPQNGWINCSITLTSTSFDAVSGISRTYYGIDGPAQFIYSEPFGINVDGKHTLSFYSIDVAGNEEDEITIPIWIDQTPPTLTFNQSNNMMVNTNYTDISWNCSDNLSGIDHSEIGIGNGAFHSIGEAMSYNFSALLDGVHMVTVKTTDKAGNEVNRTILFTVDQTPPTLTFNQSNNMTVNANHVDISWNSSDPTSGINHFDIKIDGGGFVSIGTSMSHSFNALVDGTHTVTVKAVDGAGNKIIRTIQFTVESNGDLTKYIIPVAAGIGLVCAVAGLLLLRRKK